jgi:legumain
MKFALVVLAAVLLFCNSALAANYAVLVAGSNGYYNYRHQADVCHAFQVLTKDGNIPAENIIVFMYDDIAGSPQNPTPGILINHPNGTDVYNGVTKDYIGTNVTPANFLAVITGDKSKVSGGSGRVLTSTAEDNVFVYFSDHGATGLIAFPTEYLYASDLMTALKTMNSKQMYKQLVFYIEACESGSMFQGLLPTNMSIYATTASTADQSSYACYWDATRQAYLGDEYSVRWMEDADVHDKTGASWTLEDQFKVVYSETVQSQPQQYGDLTMDTEDINEFEGLADDEKTKEVSETKILINKLRASRSKQNSPRPHLKYTPCGSASDSRDVKLKSLLNKRKDALARGLTTDELDLAINDEFQNRALSDYVFDQILFRVSRNAMEKDRLKKRRYAPRNFTCLKSAIAGIESLCGKLDDYSLKHVYTIVNACERGIPSNQLIAAARAVCSKELTL